MTIVDRSSEKSDHKSVGCKRSPFTSGDVGMDGSCSSSWAVGPTMPSDSPRLKTSGGCLGPTPGAVVYNSTPSSVDRPKEQGRSKGFHQMCFYNACVFKPRRLHIFHCLLTQAYSSYTLFLFNHHKVDTYIKKFCDLHMLFFCTKSYSLG